MLILLTWSHFKDISFPLDETEFQIHSEVCGKLVHLVYMHANEVILLLVVFTGN